MDRDAYARAGIHLPVLPTFVQGGLPGPPDWAARLARIGIDVVASGAAEDSDATLAAARDAVPYRPLKATGATAKLAEGSWLVERPTPATGAIPIAPSEVMTVVDADSLGGNPNDVAAAVLDVARAEPATWWIAAAGLGGLTADEAESILALLVEGVSMARLFLIKQQFE